MYACYQRQFVAHTVHRFDNGHTPETSVEAFIFITWYYLYNLFIHSLNINVSISINKDNKENQVKYNVEIFLSVLLVLHELIYIHILGPNRVTTTCIILKKPQHDLLGSDKILFLKGLTHFNFALDRNLL